MAEMLVEKGSVQPEQEAPWPSRSRNRIYEWKDDYTHQTLCDIAGGLRLWPLWGRMGWQDVVLRYRRSMLGPFWLTLSTGIMVFTLGVVYSSIFKTDIKEYLPYLTMSLLTWTLITGAITEGCQTFIDAEGLIRQIDLPLSIYPFRVIWRNLILFLHNIVIFVVIVVFFHIPMNWGMLMVVPGVIVVLANALWCATLLGMLVARFRDLAQIINSLLQIAFFVTPIFWSPDQMTDRRFLIFANPFYHFIEVVRRPLLGGVPTLLNWEVVALVTIVGYITTLLFYRRFHGRIAYWV